MRLTITYDKNRDVWCLLNKGKSSLNSTRPTRQYELLIQKYGTSPTVENTEAFIETYCKEHHLDTEKYIVELQSAWENIADEFHKRARAIFTTSLPYNITAYLTINSRCPYNIPDNFFYVSFQSSSNILTIMHELWHFYTWYGLGADQEKKLGTQKYNDIKESLTVLLNEEFRDFLPEGVSDVGYPQHQDMRNKILHYWKKDKNIKNLWDYLVREL